MKGPLIPTALSSDSGASLVEMALVMPLLVGLLIGMAEFGIGFRDWLSITTATREGVRVGAAAGDDIDADCFILEASAGALVSVPLEDVQELWIFKADNNGNPTGSKQRYRPSNPSDPVSILECSGGWVRTENNWPSTSRNVTTGNLDILGIRVIFNHTWITNFGPFNGTATWTDDAIMRLEPQTFS